MKITAITTTSASSKVGLATVFALTVLFGNVFSQSAEVFDAETSPAEVETVSKKKEELPEPQPVDAVPSRFAGQDLEVYILKRAAIFSMRDRETDPFGLYQDPDAKPVERKIVSKAPARRRAALPPTPLADIVKLIRVTTIMPGEKQFLVGVRSFEESDEFPLVFQGKTMRMKVVEVSARRIVFRDLDKGENATLETEMLPPGMIAGGDKLQPPGMVSPTDELPLQIESQGGIPNPNN